MHWNLLITALPGQIHQNLLLKNLSKFGLFHRTAFKDVCVGQVEDTGRFMEQVKLAQAAKEPWISDLGRVIPIETMFRFTLENLNERAQAAAAAMLDRIHTGSTFHVRVERRGHGEELASHELECTIADHLLALAQTQGKSLRVAFENPDNIVCAELVGNECGLGLLSRDLLERYPFVRPK